MNDKEKYLHKILDAVVESCSYIGGSRLSITKEDILGNKKHNIMNDKEKLFYQIL